MNGIVVPWIAEVALISWRTVRQDKRPPLPSELLATFVIFGTVGLIADNQPGLAQTFGWGVVIATALNLTPELVAPKAIAGIAPKQAGTPTTAKPS